MVIHLKSLLTFRKFKEGTRAEIEEFLKAEKLEYPKRIVYCFGFSYDHPGTFILSYIKTTTLRKEYVGLHSSGFKFRKLVFGKIEQLVAYFQEHINDPPQRSAIIESPGAALDNNNDMDDSFNSGNCKSFLLLSSLR